MLYYNKLSVYLLQIKTGCIHLQCSIDHILISWQNMKKIIISALFVAAFLTSGNTIMAQNANKKCPKQRTECCTQKSNPKSCCEQKETCDATKCPGKTDCKDCKTCTTDHKKCDTKENTCCNGKKTCTSTKKETACTRTTCPVKRK